MSFSRFGQGAEYAVGSILNNYGWSVFFSHGSRGPADLVAMKDDMILLIQVKSSNKIPRIRGFEIRRLVELSTKIDHSFPILSLVYPNNGYTTITTTTTTTTTNIISFGNYLVNFLLLPQWKSVNFINN